MLLSRDRLEGADHLSDPRASGSLVIVGTGISVAGQVTIEARAHMEQADKLLYLVADPATQYWVRNLNPSAESLDRFYGENKKRLETYQAMVDRILAVVREGGRVCVAFYGHPGVFVYPSHQAITSARAEGFDAHMLPGVSAEDCLFADLGVDPGTKGCQSFEATDFLVHRRRHDPHVALILWQIAVIGDFDYRTDRMFNRTGVQVLVEVLGEHYSGDHEVVIYEAAQYPVCQPVIERVQLADLPDSSITGISTLYVPPCGGSTFDRSILERLTAP